MKPTRKHCFIRHRMVLPDTTVRILQQGMRTFKNPRYFGVRTGLVNPFLYAATYMTHFQGRRITKPWREHRMDIMKESLLWRVTYTRKKGTK